MADPIKFNPLIPAQPAVSSGSTSTARQANVNGVSFAETLARAQDLKFSNHAQKRLQTRDIALSDDGIARLAGAVEKAEKRGGRESLVLMDDMAFIVNVKQRLVVTALDARQRGEGVFTQIDSVVFADPAQNSEA